jgi:hypothetical protein
MAHPVRGARAGCEDGQLGSGAIHRRTNEQDHEGCPFRRRAVIDDDGPMTGSVDLRVVLGEPGDRVVAAR